jgi:membrane-bound metal-dependent hydrolase YbcI (DUF457 family)
VPRWLRVYSDPLQHAAIATAVVAPLAATAGRPVVGTAVVAALAIDLDHAVAARSLRPRDTTALAQRPPTHSLVTAATVGLVVTSARGPWHGWAAFAGLVSHLLHDGGDRAAPTPLLWPWRAPRQIGRRRQIAGTAALTMGSGIAGLAAGRGRAPGADAGAGACAAAPSRTG